MSEFGRNTEEYLSVKVEAGIISRVDADIIIRFVREEGNRIGHKELTVLSNTRYVSHTVENIPKIKGWNNTKINKYVSDVRAKYKDNTARKHILLTKQFCTWLSKAKINTSLNIPALNEIKAPSADKMTKTAAMMLSTDDMEKIIKAGKNSRDRCMFAMLSESGMRPKELLLLQWGHLKFDKYGVILNTDEKTGNPRYIRLVHSSPHIAAWRADHPFLKDDAFIFVSLRAADAGKKITHSALKKELRGAVQRAGLSKRVFPYLFRHSNVTRMLEEGFSESTIRMQHWGSQSSQMLATYAHVSNNSMDREILAKAGIDAGDESTRKTREIHQCVRCKAVLRPGDDVCPNCGALQSEEITGDDNVDALRAQLAQMKADQVVRDRKMMIGFQNEMARMIAEINPHTPAKYEGQTYPGQMEEGAAIAKTLLSSPTQKRTKKPAKKQ